MPIHAIIGDIELSTQEPSDIAFQEPTERVWISAYKILKYFNILHYFTIIYPWVTLLKGVIHDKWVEAIYTVHALNFFRNNINHVTPLLGPRIPLDP